MFHKSLCWTPSVLWISKKMSGNTCKFDRSLRPRSVEAESPERISRVGAAVWTCICRCFRDIRCPAARVVGNDQPSDGEREKTKMPVEGSPDGERLEKSHEPFLSPSDGERVRV